MSDLLERLRGQAWRITPQRRAVAQALAGDHVHLTAEQVFERARAVVPEVSRATVYNTLRELVSQGQVVEVASKEGRILYDPNTAASHHHLVCLSCGELRDVYPRGDEGLTLDDSHGYRVVGTNITFEGYCPACSKRRLAAEARAR